MNIVFYDFEVFKYDWLVCFTDIMTGEETDIVNDRYALSLFYHNHKDDLFVGYNSTRYDKYIFQSILCGYNPKLMNDWIIVEGNHGSFFSTELREYPINGYDCSVGFHGLKTLEAFQGKNIHETSVPFDIDRKLTEEEIAETLKYCRNDVNETITVFFLTKQEFDAQLSLVRDFGLDSSKMEKTQAKLASVILDARHKFFRDEWDITMPDNLMIEDNLDVCEWFLNPSNHVYNAKLSTDICGVPHMLGWGGIHGAIRQYSHECADDEVLVMADVAQLYPTIMIEYDLLSRAVRKKEKFRYILDTSLRLKAEKKKKEREPYKRICNIVYGATGDAYNPMYDPLHRNLVCVFGQVFLIDLMEKLKKFKLIQSNTDGVLYLIKKKDFEEFKSICTKWEERTRFKLEYDEYSRVFQKDVNNYILVTDDGAVKTKGAYVKSLSPLDYDLPIVNTAIKEYFVKGVPVEKTINDCIKLVDFQKIFKLSSKYKYVVHNDRIYSNKVYRVFASKDFTDSYIGKVKEDSETIARFGGTPDHCKIVNDDIAGEMTPDWLDRQWYIDIAKKRIEQFRGI